MSIQSNPLIPHLLEIVTRREAQGVILTGGLGMLLKRAHLHRLQTESGTQITLVPSLPEIRVTQDIDLMLRIELLHARENTESFYDMLKDLGYEDYSYFYQFQKPIESLPNHIVKLDLMSRPGNVDESVKLRFKSHVRQVGNRETSRPGGRETPEAFAIDDIPVSMPLEYQGQTSSVLVPHPYAWLNLKVRAAHDWLREINGEIEPKPSTDGDASRRLKHVYDVYALIAMITEPELNESVSLSDTYSDHPEAVATTSQALELFGKDGAPGTIAARRYARQLGTADIDYQIFWDALTRALGITRT